MLDDSVMFAKRLRGADQPVTLCIVDDLPHGFLSLSQLSRETREATNVCAERIREVFLGKDTAWAAAAAAAANAHRKLERTDAGLGGLDDADHDHGLPLFSSRVIPDDGDCLMGEVVEEEEEGGGLAGLAAANKLGDREEIGA